MGPAENSPKCCYFISNYFNGSTGIQVCEGGGQWLLLKCFLCCWENEHSLNRWKARQIWTAIMFRNKVQISDLRFGQLYFLFIYFDTLLLIHSLCGYKISQTIILLCLFSIQISISNLQILGNQIFKLNNVFWICTCICFYC